MVDFLKIAIPYHYKEDFLNNQSFDFKSIYSHNTGEILNYVQKGKVANFKIEITQKKIVVEGSIHILFNVIKNKSYQNYNDFSFRDFLEGVEMLSKIINVDVKDMKIENIEIGVNIPISLNVREVLENKLIDWNYRTKCSTKVYVNGFGVEFETVDRYFKLYDKGGQHNIKHPLLRIEIKYMRNETIEKIAKIKTVFDLIQPDKYRVLIKNLKREINKINIVDSTKAPESLSAKQEKMFQNGTNPMFWSDYQNQGLKQQKSKFRKQYKDLLKKSKHDTIKNEIINKVNEKISILNAKNEIY